MSRSPLLALVLLATFVSPARAQDPDFLFDEPNGTFAFRSGWMFASANSDLFSFVQNQLTVDKKDFNGPAIAVDVDQPVNSRFSVMVGFEYSGSSKNSEYRDFVDNQRLPITQTTQFRQANISGGVKFAVTPPGRAISAHAWIPSAVIPYVGAGGGALWYKFHQEGDFVNFQTLAVEPDSLSSSGWTPSAHVLGGVDIKALKRLYFNVEARYLWARADLNPRVFKNFAPIDLTGTKLSAGIRYMF